MNDIEIPFIGGMVFGYLGNELVKSIFPSATECISTPLLDTTTVPIISIRDYTEIIDYPVGQTKHLLWSIYTLFDNVNYYIIYTSLDFTNPNMFNVTYYKFQKGIPSTPYKVTVDDAMISVQGDTMTLTSSLGNNIYNVSDLSVASTIKNANIDISLFQQGIAPFKYNKGNVAIIHPNRNYAKGLEVPGTATGIINGASVKGYGLSERINVSKELFKYPYNWVSVSTEDKSFIALLSESSNHFKDGCIIINGEYITPIYFEINNLSYTVDELGNNISANKRINGIFIKNNVTYLFRIDTTFLGSIEREKANECTIYINGALIGRGYGTEESNYIVI